MDEADDSVAEYHSEDHQLVAYGPHSVQNREKLAVWIAAIASVWALVEHDLVLMYAYLMGKSLPRVGKTNLPARHPVAQQVFEALHGLSSRLDLLKRLAKWEATDEEQKNIEKLAVAVRKTSLERNKIVHGMWGICEKCPHDLILYGTVDDPQARRYAEHNLKEVHKRLVNLHEDLLSLAVSIQRRLHRS